MRTSEACCYASMITSVGLGILLGSIYHNFGIGLGTTVLAYIPLASAFMMMCWRDIKAEDKK